jgi:glutaredoxin
VNVKASPENMDAMLKSSKGQREVPVIVEGDTVTIGYGGT